MASRLSSLLVRDGLVGVKRMEKAFQRQVIYGGSLDTTVLEMGLVPEERLTQYLALAAGLPPASLSDCNIFDAEAVRLCSQQLAMRYRVVPLCLDGGSLRVLVHDPVDIGLLEELADQINVPVQPLIVPEYRWHLVFSRNYGGQAPARFSTLARANDGLTAGSLLGRTKEGISETDEHQVVDVRITPLRPVGPEAVTMRLAAVSDPTSDGSGMSNPPPVVAMAPMNEGTPEPVTAGELPIEPVRRVTQNVAIPPMPKPVAPASHIVASQPPPRDSGPTSDGVPTQALADGNTPLPLTNDDRPLGVAEARELVAAAHDRESIFLGLLRGLRSLTRWAGLLTVQNGAAIGRVAIAENGLDTTLFSSVIISLDAPSPFQATINARHPYVGPISTGTPDTDSMTVRMGGVVPPTALLLPIVLRDRCVALAVAHRGGEAVQLSELTELLPLAAATAEGIGRLILRQKSAGYRVPAAAPAVPAISGDEIATKKTSRIAGDSAADWSVPLGAPDARIAAATEASIEVAGTIEHPLGSIEQILDVIESDLEASHEAAFAAALRRPLELSPALQVRFPGRLRVDRYRVSGRTLRPAQYGGLLDLVVRLGAAASELLLEKMADPRRDVRFYATACAAAIRPRSAVYVLVERLFDSDYGVRTCAIEALSGYPLRDLDLAMIRARHALHSDDLERVGAATSAIAELADVHAIDDLIDVMGRDARHAEHARRALVTLTRQDHGVSERKWRRWWDDNKVHHRVEWLIDALSHKDAALRSSAAEDLRRLTGENFGFVAEASRRDRDLARDRWLQWWGESGRRRFTAGEDERARTTGILPTTRRDP